VLDNIGALLPPAALVRRRGPTTIFLADMNDFAA